MARSVKTSKSMRSLTAEEVAAQYPVAVDAMAQAQKRSTKEARIQHAIVNCLEALKMGPVIGQEVGAREADIFVSDRQCVIEVKATGQCDPVKIRKSVKSSTVPGPNESQVQQLSYYVRGIALEHEARKGPTRKPWWGVLTDGRKLWIYRYGLKAIAKENPRDPEPMHSFGWPLIDDNPAVVIHHLLQGPLAESTGKPWASQHIYQVAFAEYDQKTKEIYDILRQQDHHGLKTKFGLWYDQMRASGLAPRDIEDQRRLFCKHTFLVAVAKVVIASLEYSPQEPGSDNKYHGIGEGFTAWLTERAAGRKLIGNLYKVASRYDWQMRESDVLRNLYQDCIPPADRKLYGEYYTPDWLAEMLAEKVLDEEWIERSVEIAHRAMETGDHEQLQGMGVLDPTCGSGTFLYHATRLLVQARYWEEVSATPRQIANGVALLVHGIDIHPVAVEMARATVLRALPAEPTVELRIAEGDSLLIERGQAQYQLGDDGSILRQSPGGVWLKIPDEFIRYPGAPSLITDLVTSANDGKPFPREMPPELQTDDMRALHKDLTQVCRDEGNSVWVWWLKNILHPHRLSAQKVDRILANPPWVRMSTIQEAERKQEMIELAKKLNVWGGRMVATSFDIAALFIERCTNTFVKEAGSSRAAWVTNEAAVRATSWAKWRKESIAHLKLTLEMGKLKEPPFTGARSAVLINDGRSAGRRKELLNKRNGKVQRQDSWRKVKSLVKEKKVQQASWEDKRSPYADRKKMVMKGEEWRQGPTIVPDCLLKIEEKIDRVGGAKTECRMAKSTHKPWSEIEQLELEVPKDWIQKIVGPQAIHPFYISENILEFMIPTDEDGLIDENKALLEPCWKEADRIYKEYMGKGSSTPKSLWAQINYRRKLEKGFQNARAGKHTVVYNRSGSWLKSAYGKALLAQTDVCWLGTDNEEEAKYLTAVLNANCLQEAFRQARESDRHFQFHIWRKIPIPIYDEEKLLHGEIAALYSEAKEVAVQCLDPTHGPLKQDRIIREALQESEVMKKINALAKRLLPEYTA